MPLPSYTSEKPQLSGIAFWISFYLELQSSSSSSSQRDVVTAWVQSLVAKAQSLLRATLPPPTIPQSMLWPTSRVFSAFLGFAQVSLLIHIPRKLHIWIAFNHTAMSMLLISLKHSNWEWDAQPLMSSMLGQETGTDSGPNRMTADQARGMLKGTDLSPR